MLDFDIGDIKFIFSNIKINDIFDILIVTCFIFVLFWFLRKTKSLKIILGFLFFLILYIFSSWFNFSLTYKILQSLAGILVIILVVIFQEELRRMFYFLSNYQKHSLDNFNSSFLKELGETVFNLARNKVGALILIPGKEPIFPHISGGTLANANFSSPLLLSIFDNSSPGHDGAVVLDLVNSKIKLFGVHLPLSKNLLALKDFGTRHSAGLGIAEKTDALSIIVSEEKGVVHIARNGKMHLISDEKGLEEAIKNFLSYLGQTKEKKKKLIFFLNQIKTNFLFIVISLFLAFSIWGIVSYPNLGIVQKSFIVPIEFVNISPSYAVGQSKPIEVIATFRGHSQDFKLLDQSNLKAIVDLSNFNQVGSYKVTLSSENLKYPSSLSLVDLNPNVVNFKLVILNSSQTQNSFLNNLVK